MKTFSAATLLATVGVFALAGCASTGNITPQYVPPSTYQNYDCQALNQEYNRVNRYVESARSQQSSLSTSGVGVGVSAGRWGISPNISFGVGKSNNTKARDAKLSRLYGERDAIVQSARIQRCSFVNGIKIYGE
jgi:predicted small lipoprotein YifL